MGAETFITRAEGAIRASDGAWVFFGWASS